jgi:hypothetical protein
MESILNTPNEYIAAYMLVGYYVWPWLGYLWNEGKRIASKTITYNEEAIRGKLWDQMRHISSRLKELNEKSHGMGLQADHSQVVITRLQSDVNQLKQNNDLDARCLAVRVTSLEERLVNLSSVQTAAQDVATIVGELKQELLNIQHQLLDTQRDAKASVENFTKGLEAVNAKVGPIKYIDSALLDMLRNGCRKFVLDLLDKLRDLKEEEWNVDGHAAIQTTWKEAGLTFKYIDPTKGIAPTKSGFLPSLTLSKTHLDGENVGKSAGRYVKFSSNERLLFFFHFHALCDKLCKTFQVEPTEYVERLNMVKRPLSQRVEEAFGEIAATRFSSLGDNYLLCLKKYLLEHGPISRKQLDKPSFYNTNSSLDTFFGTLAVKILESLMKRGLVTEDKQPELTPEQLGHLNSILVTLEDKQIPQQPEQPEDKEAANKKIDEIFEEIKRKYNLALAGVRFVDFLRDHVKEHGPVSRKQLDENPFRRLYCPDNNFGAFFGAWGDNVLAMLRASSIVKE